MRLLNENFRINIQLRDIIPNFVLLKKWGIKLEEAYLLSDTKLTKNIPQNLIVCKFTRYFP